MRSLRILTPLFILILSFTLNAQTITCTLKGKVTGRNSKMLLLVAETEDWRFSGDSIPIVDGSFTYVMKVPEIQKYQLFFIDELETGVSRPVEFFPENGKVEFNLYSFDDFPKNVVTGGVLNRKKNDFGRQRDSLFSPRFRPWNLRFDSLRKAGGDLSEKAQTVMDKIRSTEDQTVLIVLYDEQKKLREEGEWESKEAAALSAGWNAVDRDRMYWQNDYIKENIDLLSYSMIYNELKNYSYYRNIDVTFINDIFPAFRKKFPGHVYTDRVGAMLNAINKLKIGESYIDFEAPTLDGRTVRLSDSIRGKVAVIDLWASWCGPCRALSKSMIPVYEKYREKGFTIVGVACEYQNTDRLIEAIKKDRLPWLNLVEMDNRRGIWEKYNISGSGGCTYLVDRDGKIVAIHPMAAELDKLVGELCK